MIKFWTELMLIHLSFSSLNKASFDNIKFHHGKELPFGSLHEFVLTLT